MEENKEKVENCYNHLFNLIEDYQDLIDRPLLKGIQSLEYLKQEALKRKGTNNE